MLRVALSTYVKSAAYPAPIPWALVGVFTETKIMSARVMALTVSVEKNKFFPRHSFVTSSKPGSKMGKLSEFQASMRGWLKSTTSTITASPAILAIMQLVGPPT
eukprot:Lithocolla_globosa_v1_NODE_818_length_3236_cov_18.549026.p5 type:complete len:104 gc:universal NODE_818_length_3236_cov_18.549026:1275-1586(+)